jgi:diadenosine tetraphosphate (Ap4A) HIT family hydrolase
MSVAMLRSDQFFRGYTLVALKEHVAELYHLPPEQRIKFCEEMIQVAAAIDKAFHPDKMNYSLLGNIDAHMHWHLIPRYKDDPLWGKPTWAQPHDKKMLTEQEYQNLIGQIRKHLV